MSVTTGLQLPFGVQPVNPVPVDAWSGPFTGSIDTFTSAVAAANSSIPAGIRFQSMEVRIIVGGTSYKYWYRDGIADVDLVPFASGGGGGTPGGSDTNVQFNDGGFFGGNNSFVFDKGTSTLSVPNISGSLTRLTDGSSYIVAGDGIQVVTASNGSLVITNTGAPGDITAVYSGNGLTGGGDHGDVTLSIDDSVVATLSGSTFRGPVKFNAGLSGSLTKLTDGSPYLVAGSNISVSTNLNGSITIASTAGAGNTVSFMRWMEVPVGDVDGINTVYSLSKAPAPANALMLYVNGVLQRPGAENDYYLTSNTFMLNYPPVSGSHLLATYRYTDVVPTGKLMAWLENVSGPTDGLNKTFHLSSPPSPTNSLMLYVNGVLQTQSVDKDYVLVSGSTVQTRIAPLSGSVLVATYEYDYVYPVLGKNTSWMEIPSGSADGVTNVFGLSNVPLPLDATMLYINGILQRQGPTYDYVLSGTIVTMNYFPQSGSNLLASYPYDPVQPITRAKYYANVLFDVAPDNDASLLDGNLDAALPDMSGGNFLNDYDVYLNGDLLRPGYLVGDGNDYYPGTSVTDGQLRFATTLKTGDVICVIPDV
jgi:hypothetical protein